MKLTTRREIIKSALYTLMAGLAPTINGSCFGDRSEIAGPPLEPGYLKLHKSGELRQRGEYLWARMENCDLCPRLCGVNKLKGQKGFCGAGAQLEISDFYPHFGEERPLVGSNGSGTIFLTNCGLRCVFCINWETSQGGDGHAQQIENFAKMMLSLQAKGCPNINFVTPTHYAPHILLAVDKAAAGGLRVPLVYNTCGWERLAILKILDGIVDIYLPDFKYADNRMAAKYSSGAHSYVEDTQSALLEMHRQVGVARPGADGLVHRGLMIRHLIMPNNISGTRAVIDWIAHNLPKDTYVNLMAQYTPAFKASKYPEIARRITYKEYRQAVDWARAAGLSNLDIQRFAYLTHFPKSTQAS